MTDDRTGPKIGVLVPFTNTNLEPDMQLLRPRGVTFHFERMGGYDVDEIPGSEQMAGLGASDITETLHLISGVRPSAVLYGCTSATLTHGPAFDRDLAAQIKARSGARSITAAGALVQTVKVAGSPRVGFASPYLGEINAQAAAFLQSEGIEVAHQADIGRALGNYGQGELTPAEVFDLALKADSDAVEALVLSCTDMRAVEAIQHIEAATGKMVITSNQAMIFQLCVQLDLPPPVGSFGRVFELLS